MATIVGTNGDDGLNASNNGDTLIGGDGNDTLIGDSNADSLLGGIVLIDHGSGNTIILVSIDISLISQADFVF
ncbi:hypothetical protein [Kordiimonas marina]|uniref:hypothetical protein n=1 Tax=Kordiimonas marina TaxID=2872312 RepID=UPI001FF100B7|nr:hypothetical protein [Kordiimonas marina]MCJ9428423.1 hypothetical protein [Kordiimonas marina]